MRRCRELRCCSSASGRYTSRTRTGSAIGYDGWFVFETAHHSQQEVVEATEKNIRFVAANLAK
jgi:hypothetical protein